MQDQRNHYHKYWTARIGNNLRPTNTSPQPRQVHTGEGLLLADKDQITYLDNSIDSDDLPLENEANSEECQEQNLLMRGMDNY